jgi:transposase
MPKRTPERIAQAKALAALGFNTKEIAAKLGVAWHTAKTLIDPEAYARHKAKAIEWQMLNPESANRSKAAYQRRPDVAEKRRTRNVQRYQDDPAFRARCKAWTAEYQVGLQARLGAAIRAATWNLAHGDRAGSGVGLLSECAGIPPAELKTQLVGGGSTDHIVPLARFDLTDPVQLLQAVHHTNVRSIPLAENMRRPDDDCAGIDIATLPFATTIQARRFAERLIRRVVNRWLKSACPPP